MQVKKLILFCLIMMFLVSCNNESEKKIISFDEKNKILTNENELLKSKILNLTDTISKLRFSASDRLYQIKISISKNEIEIAKKQIFEIKSLFPFAKEIKEIEKLELLVSQKEEEQRKINEKIKTLGYKIFKDNTSAKLSNESYNVSGFNFAKTFTFDYVNEVDEYHYRTADKDRIYLLFSLALSTKDNYASVPGFCLYEVKNGILYKTSFIESEYASWSSYGAFIGNYTEDSHDFSKVNTVNYKLGFEIEKIKSNQPLFIIVNKDGTSPDETLTIEKIQEQCVVVKIVNRSKL